MSTATWQGSDVWRDVARRATEDDGFKQQLMDNPKGVLADNGLNLPDDVNVSIVENEPGLVHFVLPSSEILEAPEVHAVSLSEYNAACY